MKTLFGLIAILVIFACQQRTHVAHAADQPTVANTNDSARLQDLFTQEDAVCVLGKACHSTDSTLLTSDDVVVYKRTYVADAVDAQTGKTGTLYIMIEQYATIDSARQVYSSIRQTNAAHGIADLQDMGDEAYYHSDGQNFLFILARKGGRMLRMKVNKTTSHTAREEFERVGREVVGRI